jgi:ribosome maturation factor RimP
MVMDARTVTQEVTDLVAPILEEMGYELVDVAWVMKSGRWVLQLFIDKEGGVTIDDCAAVSGEIGDLIDVRDIIPHGYVLEVSSPGLDRPLKKLKDFRGAIGRKVKIRTARPKEGRRNFTGRLERVEEDVITLLVDGTEQSFVLEELEKANLVYEF